MSSYDYCLEISKSSIEHKRKVYKVNCHMKNYTSACEKNTGCLCARPKCNAISLPISNISVNLGLNLIRVWTTGLRCANVFRWKQVLNSYPYMDKWQVTLTSLKPWSEIRCERLWLDNNFWYCFSLSTY